MNRILMLSLVALALAPGATAALSPGAINIVNFAFEDATTGLYVTAASAGTVTWANIEGVHTATAQDGAFDSGALEPGDSFSADLATGSYVYTCIFHPTMRGILVVV